MSKPTRGRPLLRSLFFVTLFLAMPLVGSQLACSQDEAASSGSASGAADSPPGAADSPPGAAASPPGAAASPPGAAASTGDHGGAGHDSAASANRLASSKKKGEKAARHPNERPVPSFVGTTIAGTKVSMRDLLGSRVVLFFVNPENENAVPVTQAVNRLMAESADHNFRFIGIGIGVNAGKLGRFAKEQGLQFPMIDDSSADIAGTLRLNAPIALLGVDADGYMTFGMGGFPDKNDVDVAEWTEEQLRTHLRLPEVSKNDAGKLDMNPAAPDLGVVAMSSGDVVETKDLAGRSAIVIFFLHTCPHCHRALEAIKDILASIPEANKPRLVAISVQNSPAAIRKSMAELGLDFFDPYLDPGEKASKRWGVTGGVPVVSVLDKRGKIIHRSQGWSGQRDAGMLRMQVSRAAEVRVPMLLEAQGYSGNDVCGVCHEKEYATWQYTKHATAFDTLVTHTADRRTDCIGCHVVGFEKPGGYDFSRRPAHLENVGCESCHGRGGPHLSPDFVKKTATPDGGYAAVCGTCHTPAHSLGFDYATFHPRVSHTRIASLSDAERADLVEGGGPKRDLLPTQADYVGSAACQSCHTKEFETWQASPHGHAVATLEAKGKAGDADCLQCHTTAYGETGGFQPAVPVPDQADLARVGCESCHGAGGDHVGENAKRVGTILSLGDKCDSCVILKVCGTCHDDANDSGFEFEVEERIEAQRHGTTPSAATRAGESAFHPLPNAAPYTTPSTTPHPTPRAAPASPPNMPDTRDVEPEALAAGDRALLHSAFERLDRAAGTHASGPGPDPS